MCIQWDRQPSGTKWKKTSLITSFFRDKAHAIVISHSLLRNFIGFLPNHVHAYNIGLLCVCPRDWIVITLLSWWALGEIHTLQVTTLVECEYFWWYQNRSQELVEVIHVPYQWTITMEWSATWDEEMRWQFQELFETAEAIHQKWYHQNHHLIINLRTMLPFRCTLVNNKCLYIYRHNIQWIPNIYIMMGTFYILIYGIWC